jgi:DNA-binding NarL/FixJ family response regulator
VAPGVGEGDRIRVLLADDDSLFLESLRPLVEGQGELTVVATAENGLDAIERVEELRPDALVIDLHMPLIDGVTTLAHLRRDNPTLCLIALTGDHDPELHKAAEEAGADAVLLKDELLDTLLKRLSEVRSSSMPAPPAST